MPKRKSVVCFSGVVVLVFLAGFYRAIAQVPDDQVDTHAVVRRLNLSPTGRILSDPKGRRDWMRLRMGGAPTSEYKERMVREALRERELYPDLAPGALALGVPTWTNLGPESDSYIQNGGITLNEVDSGRVREILQDPKNLGTMYVLTAGGGLWKTTNLTSTGATWVPMTDSLHTTSGGAMAFGHLTSTLYLGLGDPFDNFALVGGGMVKSTDGGTTWSAFIDLTGSTSVRDVKVDRRVASDIVLVATDAGLFRSVDSGISYSAVAAGTGEVFNGKGLWSIVQTSAGWLASAQDAVGAGSLWISTDHGATWNSILDSGNVFTGAGRTTLAIGKPGDSVVYAFAANTGDVAQLDLFRSNDGGQSWTALNITGKVPINSNADQPTMDLMARQAFYNQMILVDPSDSARNTVYLGGEFSSAKTADGGQTWTLLTHWLARFGLPYAHADFHAAEFATISGVVAVVFGTDGGLSISMDGGAHWTTNKNIGLTSHLLYSIVSNPGTAGSVLSGFQDDGTRVRSGITSTFNQSLGGDGFGVGWSQAAVPASEQVSLATVPFSFIFRNVGNNPPAQEANWQLAISGIDTTDAVFATPMTTPSAAADPDAQHFFTSTFQHVYMTRNQAEMWVEIGTSGSRGISSTTFIRPVPHAVAVSPLDLDHVAAAGTGGVILLTANGGASWIEAHLNTLVTGWSRFNASVAYANDSIIYACSESPTPGAVRVARSTDGGTTWAAANGALPDVAVFKVQVDPRDTTGNTVYAATFLGLYKTTDGGRTWARFGAGLPQVSVTDIYMPADGSALLVSTFGRGVWAISP